MCEVISVRCFVDMTEIKRESVALYDGNIGKLQHFDVRFLHDRFIDVS